MLSGLVWWIVVGLIAGWLAGKVMRGGGFGVLMDIVIGMVGAVIGGWVFGLLGIYSNGGLIGSVLVAFVGAVILLWLVRMIKKAKRMRGNRRAVLQRNFSVVLRDPLSSLC